MARVGDFASTPAPVSPDTPGAHIFERFRDEPDTLAIAVVDDAGRPVGLQKAAAGRNPPHPGEVLQDTVMSSGEITVTEFAKRLRVSRVALSRVLHARAAVSADMALALAAALGGSAESSVQMQAAYDLWQASKRRRPKIERLKLAA